MAIGQILRGLEAVEAQGAKADQAARLGFLEWVCSLDGDPQTAARSALDGVSVQSHAACAFVDFLQLVAAAPVGTPVRRGGAAARRKPLH